MLQSPRIKSQLIPSCSWVTSNVSQVTTFPNTCLHLRKHTDWEVAMETVIHCSWMCEAERYRRGGSSLRHQHFIEPSITSYLYCWISCFSAAVMQPASRRRKDRYLVSYNLTDHRIPDSLFNLSCFIQQTRNCLLQMGINNDNNNNVTSAQLLSVKQGKKTWSLYYWILIWTQPVLCLSKPSHSSVQLKINKCRIRNQSAFL